MSRREGGRAIFHPRDRLVGLSDGVFAVAITLLSIDVVAKGTAGGGEDLAAHLLSEWPAFAAYLFGFLTILVCWINHQVVYEHVTRMDTGLVWINGLQLALVALVPFPTALLAEHLLDADAGVAFAIYGVTFLLIAFSFWATARYIGWRGLADEHADPGVDRGLTRCYAISVAWTVLCLALCAVSVIAAIAGWALMFIVFAFPLQFAHWMRDRIGAGEVTPGR